jgi:hypothetical protein
LYSQIDPGFIAGKLQATLRQAEMKVLEATCIDEEAVCKAWAEAGECSKNTGFMLQKCKRSCLDAGMQEACPGLTSSVPRKPKCYDESPDCGDWATNGQCETNAGYMSQACRSSCKICTMRLDGP